MTELIASKIGSLWVPFIIKDKVIIGEVVNVFRRTINIKDTNNMLLSITALNYSSPIYVNIDYGDYNQNWSVNLQEHVRPYERVFFSKPYIIIGKLRIRTKLLREKIVTPHICSICGLINSTSIKQEFKDFLMNLYKRINFLINIIDKPNNILELVEKMNMEKKIFDIVREIKRYVIERNYVPTRKIYSILGLGYGVTPSSDDFLSGLLGAINVYLTCNNIEPLILNKNLILEKTNWVSGFLLYYNHFGLFNNILEGFLESIFRMKYVDSLNLFLSLLSIGHTSGLDMTLGVLAALAVILEVLHGEIFIEEYFELFFEN